MNVVHVISGLGTGGAEMMLLKLLKQQNALPVQHTVICLQESGRIGDEIHRLGVELHVLGAKSRFLAPVVLFRALKIIKSSNPDLIQGWMYDGNLAASVMSMMSAAGLSWNIRHSVFDIKVEPFRLRLALKLGGLLSKSVDKIIYNSSVAEKQHMKMGFCPDNSCVIPNGFNPDEFQPNCEHYRSVRKQLNIPYDCVLIGMVARYHPMKNHQAFINAATIIYSKYKNVRFMLVGKGINLNNKNIIQSLNEYNLIDVFHLLEERHDMPRINAAMDICVSSSAWGEGFPNVLGEAMLCEVPCVSTDVGDTSIVIGDTGMIVESNADSKLASAILDLVNDVELRKLLGQKARQRIIDNFSLATISEHYIKAWDAIT